MDSASEQPKSQSVLCSLHFKAECFDTDGRLYYEPLGIGQARRRLMPDAIPTVFLKPEKSRGNTGEQPAKKRRTAMEKLEQARGCMIL